MSRSRGRHPKTKPHQVAPTRRATTKIENERSTTAQRAPQRRRFSRWWQAMWGVIGPIITLVSVGFWLEPAITIEPTVSLNRSESLATQFKVTNTGHLPVYNLHFRCEYGPPIKFGNAGLDMTGSTFGPAAVLSPGDPITRSCADPSSHEVGTPNMQITAFYKWPTPVIGKTFSVPAFFRVVKGNDGYFLLPDQMPAGWHAGLTLNGPERD
jgi:hypothetical protein